MRRGLHVQVQRFPVLGVVELPGPVLLVNVTLSLLHPVLLVQVLVVVLLVHPLLGQPSVLSAMVAGCKDRFHRISERA